MLKKSVLSFTAALGILMSAFALSGCSSAYKAEGQKRASEQKTAAASYIATVTYVIGDEALENSPTALAVDGDAEKYGVYRYDADGNVYTFSRHDVGWTKAMSEQTSAQSAVCVKLASDWVAQPTARVAIGKNEFQSDKDIELLTSFGDEQAFPYGRIEVPQGMYVKLDLNGCVIDRALTDEVQWYGQVIYGYNCGLEIADSMPTKEHKEQDVALYTYTDDDGETTAEVTGGVITGGYNRYNYLNSYDTYYRADRIGGGISVGVDAAGSADTGLFVTGGTIYGNNYTYYSTSISSASRVTYTPMYDSVASSGVFVDSAVGAPLYIGENGSIVKNAAGVNKTALTLDGGIVADGGVNIADGEFAMKSGKIFGCGDRSGVLAVGSTINLLGGEISNNLCGVIADNSDVTLGGATITDNACVDEYFATFIENVANDGFNNDFGGFEIIAAGVSCVLGRLDIQSGYVKNNHAKYVSDGYGAVGVACKGVSFSMSGGEISGNEAELVADYSSSIEDFICGGLSLDNVWSISDELECVISGGTISNNNGNSGIGGVVLYDATFRMEGGEISGNYGETAGALSDINWSSDVTICGGSIVDNTSDSKAGIYIAGKFKLYGDPVISGNMTGANERNIGVNRLDVVGELEDGAHIGIANVNSLQNYAKFNNDADSETGYNYVIDPSKYFYIESGSGVVAVDGSGNLVVIDHEFEFSAGYGDDPTDITMTAAPDVYGATFEYIKDYSAAASLTYDGEPVDFDDDAGDMADVGSYELSYTLGGRTYKFVVVIAPRDLSDDDGVAITAEDDVLQYAYDGTAKTPAISSVEYGGDTLTLGADYTVDHENNVNAGTGNIVIEFTGKYTGVKRVPFTITASGGTYYTAVWQYFDGTQWKNATGAEIPLVYTPGVYVDKTNYVRAELTLAGDGVTGDEPKKYAYADGIASRLDSTITKNDIGAYKVTLAGGGTLKLDSAGIYSLVLTGTDNYAIGDQGIAVNIGSVAVTSQNVAISLSTAGLVYDGAAKTPDVTVVFEGGVTLTEGVDYDVTYSDGTSASGAIIGGAATATVSFKGNYTGVLQEQFIITQAVNDWTSAPSVVWWSFGGFSAEHASVSASPAYLFDGQKVHVSVLGGDRQPVTTVSQSLADIAVELVSGEADGMRWKVNSQAVSDALNKLPVGSYTLAVWVEETTCYTAIATEYVPFEVTQAHNYWTTAPSLKDFYIGEYDEEVNMPVAVARFGEDVHIVIRSASGDEVVYETGGVNKLGELSVGSYYITATVDGTNNYTALSDTAVFRVFEARIQKTGLPWWAVVLIVICALGVAALVIFILHKKGVFSLLSQKMVVAIRAKADIDATIAAVRAGQVTAYANASIAEAEARDAQEAAEQEKAEEKERQKAERRAEALAKAAKTPEERATALEKRASDTERRAAALNSKAEAMKSRASAIRARAAKTADAAQTQNPEKETQKPEKETQKPENETTEDNE
ncbi:MAG: hypothetical protein NC184_06660 [Roseburia sp.]|nr:hypothetical protein [Roseburia sp.]